MWSIKGHHYTCDLVWPWRSFKLFDTSLNLTCWKYSTRQLHLRSKMCYNCWLSYVLATNAASISDETTYCRCRWATSTHWQRGLDKCRTAVSTWANRLQSEHYHHACTHTSTLQPQAEVTFDYKICNKKLCYVLRPLKSCQHLHSRARNCILKTLQ